MNSFYVPNITHSFPSMCHKAAYYEIWSWMIIFTMYIETFLFNHFAARLMSARLDFSTSKHVQTLSGIRYWPFIGSIPIISPSLCMYHGHVCLLPVYITFSNCLISNAFSSILSLWTICICWVFSYVFSCMFLIHSAKKVLHNWLWFLISLSVLNLLK